MQWISHFDLFLFDFDGVLVNTEKFHYIAYQRMCAARGYHLDWDFATYSSYALYDPHALQKEIYKKFAKLHAEEPRWDVLYKEKKHYYSELIASQENILMPGVESLLSALQEQGIKSCVVTHSAKEHVEPLRKKHKALERIPFWITREDYEHPKPHPECYEKAILRYSNPGKSVIGFEDSPRGFQALEKSLALPVFVSSVIAREEIASLAQRPFLYFPSFEELCTKDSLF